MTEIIVDILIVLFLSLVSASFSLFLDYALGKPQADAGEIATKEILFPFTYYLSLKRLKREHDEDFIKSFDQEEKEPEGLVGFKTEKRKRDENYRSELQDQNKKDAIVVRARTYFTFEKAIGMCIYCTGFWVSVLVCIVVSLMFGFSAFQFFALLLCVPFISHLVLRKII